MTKSSRKPRRRDQVVRLEDLAPRKDIIGGSGRTVFGQTTVRPPGKPDQPRRPAGSDGEREPSE
jgi:hypothetical protein